MPAQFQWTGETRKVLAGGDVHRGAALAEKCARCHGIAGYSRDEEVPHLAGQHATYVFKQLWDYKSGARAHGPMKRSARRLSEQDMADLSAWYASWSFMEARKLETGSILQPATIDPAGSPSPNTPASPAQSAGGKP